MSSNTGACFGIIAAAALDRLPGVAEAFAAGTINDAHAAAIAKLARDISPEALAGGAEELLVRQAKELARRSWARAGRSGRPPPGGWPATPA